MNGYEVIIIGGGPAGSSAAAHLAARGVRVVLLEKGRMPRQKLCGEFITPECFPTLNRLGVMDRILIAGAQKITQLSLIGSNGKRVEAPLSEMSDKSSALGLSRARFDEVLFNAARQSGAVCLESHAVKRCLYDDGRPTGVEAMSIADGRTVTFYAPLVVDASGRNSRAMVGKHERTARKRGSRLFAMKAHLKGVEGIAGRVELYFFPGGYGGLSSIEDGLMNLCFITDEAKLGAMGGNAASVMRQTVLRNPLANERLSGAGEVRKWESAGPLVFGRRRLAQSGVIAIGDASGMIDPFTGTGIQIALRTGELAAEAIIEAMGSTPAASARPTESRGFAADAAHHEDHNGKEPAPASSLEGAVLARYAESYEREFGKRMKIAGLLRAPAFSPRMASLFGYLLSVSPRLARGVLRASRSGREVQARMEQPE
ncbi:MAG TPA: FAD-dependent oxidoreductase [Blastocatellia bacterium]|nr:FAD-dependent oxidoreductase [Blastocatellia bacterium]